MRLRVTFAVLAGISRSIKAMDIGFHGFNARAVLVSARGGVLGALIAGFGKVEARDTSRFDSTDVDSVFDTATLEFGFVH